MSTREFEKGFAEQALGETPEYASDQRTAVLEFVRTPLAVRCGIVKVWRPLPSGLWNALTASEDEHRSRRQEHRALVCVVLMAMILLGGFSSVGYRSRAGQTTSCFPLMGPPLKSDGGEVSQTGWYWAPGQSVSLAFWIVVPTLVGWFCVRGIWIRFVAAGRSSRGATMAMARYLSGVYLYVYLMVLVGAALMPLLIWASPERTETIRWCLRWFLFGESFFVPAVMWIRLVRNDSSGAVFGQSREVGLAGYLVGCVAIPVTGMLWQPA